MRSLVAGGSGMFGRVLMKTLAGSGEVTGVSKSGKYGTLICDLANAEQIDDLFSSNRPDMVIHTAAYSDVDGCERDPKLAHESNALATKYLAQNCGARGIPFIYISTDYVFDGRKKTLYTEKDVTCPVNVYGMTKLEGEHYTRSCAPVSAVVRTSWLFGAGNPNNFVNAITERLRKEKIVRVLADQEDSPTYVKDLAFAVQKIGEYLAAFIKKTPDLPCHEIFQVCNAGVTTRYEMALKIKECLRLKDVSVEKLDKMPAENRPAIRPSFVAMSTRHYETLFKSKLRRWEESLKEYLNEAA